jgi:hypothetical protein
MRLAIASVMIMMAARASAAPAKPAPIVLHIGGAEITAEVHG